MLFLQPSTPEHWQSTPVLSLAPRRSSPRWIFNRETRRRQFHCTGVAWYGQTASDLGSQTSTTQIRCRVPGLSLALARCEMVQVSASTSSRSRQNRSALKRT
jgi:hypothetical protein